VLLKEYALKGYAIDFLAMNLLSLAISALLYLTGREIVDTFIVVLFVESAFVLILGGVFGFVLSSISYYALERLLGRKGAGKEKQEIEPQKDVTKKQIATGKRFVVLGMALLAESILIAFLLIL
jgi:hypothetical protein